jgi:hypothetical protein
MTSDRETARVVRSWLEEGVTALPDRVLDDVLDQLPRTRQRRAWWPRWALPRLNKSAGLALAGAAVVVVAIFGATYLSTGGGVGGLPGEPVPTSAVSPRPLPGTNVRLAGGTYVLDDPFPVPMILEVPRGWSSCGVGDLEVGVCVDATSGIAFQIIENVVVDPCDQSRVMLDPPVGPSVEDLVTAISNLPGFEATEPIEIRMGRFAGQQLVVTAPARPDCELSDGGLATWSTPDRVNGVGAGEVNLLRIFDIDGVRVMISAAHHPGETRQRTIDEMELIMDSIRVAP